MNNSWEGMHEPILFCGFMITMMYLLFSATIDSIL